MAMNGRASGACRGSGVAGREAAGPGGGARAAAGPAARPAAARLAGLLLLAGAALGLLAAGAPLPAAAQTPTTLVSNTGQDSIGSASYVGALGTDNYQSAQGFTTGDHAAGYTLSAVDVVVLSSNMPTPRVSIYSATVSGNPGSSLHVLTAPATIAAGTMTFAAPANATLDANTDYFVVMEDTGTGSWSPQRSDSADEDAGAASGWSIADDRRSKGTGSWATGSHTHMIAIKGTANSGSSTVDPPAELTGLVLHDGVGAVTLSPAFAAGTLAYTASVAAGVTRVTVTPSAATGTDTAILDAADMAVTDADTNLAGTQVDVAVGANTIKVKASGTGLSAQTYTVTLTRAALPAAPATGANTDGSETVWGAQLAVGKGVPSENAQVTGFDSGSALSVGGVSSNSFTAGSANYTVTWLRRGQNTVILLDQLSFAPNPLFPVADDARYVLDVGGTQYKFGDTGGTSQFGRYPSAAIPNYSWRWSAITGWTQNAVIPVKLIRLNPPAAPTNFAVSAEATKLNRLTLSWTASATDGGSAVTGHEYCQKTTAGETCEDDDWTAIDDSAPGETNDESFTVTGLDNGTTYYFRVRAVNAIGKSDATGELSDTVPEPPATVTSLALHDGVSNVTLSPAGAQTPLDFTASVTAGVTRVTVTVTAPDGTDTEILDAADMAVTDADAHTAGFQVDVAVGANTIKVKASGTGLSAQTYTVTLTRAALPAAPATGANADGSETVLGAILAVGQLITVDGSIESTITGFNHPRGNLVPSSFDVGTTNYTIEQIFRNLILVNGSPVSDNLEFKPAPQFPVAEDARYVLDLDGQQYNVGDMGRQTGFYLESTHTIAWARNDIIPVKLIRLNPPVAPTGLKVTAGEEQVTLAWTASTTNGGSAVTGHEYCQKTTAGETCEDADWTAIDDSAPNGDNDDSFTVTGLDSGTTYYFRVRAVNAIGKSAASNEVSGTPGVTAPDAPTGLAATAGEGSAALEWTAGAGSGGAPTKHQYCTKTDTSACAEEDWTDIPDSAPGEDNDESYTVPDLANGTAYTFRVRAVNAGGASAATSTASATPAAVVPGVPAGHTLVWEATLSVKDLGSGIRGCDVTSTNAKCSTATVLSDDDFTFDGTDYSIVRLFVGSTELDIGLGTPAKATAAKATALTLHVGGASFTFASATGIGSNLSWKAPDLHWTVGNTVNLKMTAPAVPTAPRALTVVPGNGSVALAWTPSANDRGSAVTGHEYCRKETATAACGSSDWTAIANSGAGGTNATSFTVTSGLSNGTQYYFRVRAANANGKGAASNQATARPSAVSLPAGYRIVWEATLTVDHWSGSDRRGFNKSTGNGSLEPASFKLGDQSIEIGHLLWDATTGGVGNLELLNADGHLGLLGTDFILQLDSTSLRGTATNVDLGLVITEWQQITNAWTDGQKVQVRLLIGIPPDAPTGLTATAGEGSAALAWTAGTGSGGAPTKHQYCTKTDTSACAEEDWTDIPDSAPGEDNDESYTVPDLANGTAYTFRVRAVNAGGASAATSAASATPAAVVPSVPAGHTLVWEATLSVKGLFSGTFRGCVHNQQGSECSTATVLSDDDFTFENTDYGIRSLYVHAHNTGTRELVLEVATVAQAEKVRTSPLVLHAGGASFALASDKVETGVLLGWDISDLYWTVGNTVNLKITAPATQTAVVPELPENHTELLRAELTVQDLGTSGLGCHNGQSGNECSTASVLSEDGFAYDGQEPEVTRLQVAPDGTLEFHTTTITNTLTVFQEIESDFTLHLGGSSFAFSSTDSYIGFEASWIGSGLTWSAGETVHVLLETSARKPAAPTGFTVTPRPQAMDLAWTPGADNGSFIRKHQYCQQTGSIVEVCEESEWQDIPDSAPGGANERSWRVRNLTHGELYTFMVRAVNALGGGPRSAFANSSPLSGTGVSFAEAEADVDEGASVTVTVELGQAPAAPPVTVPLTATAGPGLAAGEYSGVPQEVVFAANETSKSFTVTFTGPGDGNEPDETLTLGFGALPTGYLADDPVEMVLTVLDGDAPAVTVAFAEAEVQAREGERATVALVVSEAPEREVRVPLVAAAGAALAESVPSEAVFGPEDTEARVTVAFVERDNDRSDGSLTLRLGSPLPLDVTAGMATETVVRVADDDGPPEAVRSLRTAVASGTVTLGWDAPAANDNPVQRYEVRVDEGSWQRIGTALEHTEEGLEDERAYAFAVRAVNRFGAGPEAEVAATPTAAVSARPGAPVRLEVGTDYSKRAVLTWFSPWNDRTRRPPDGVRGMFADHEYSRIAGYGVQVWNPGCNPGSGSNWCDVAVHTGSTGTRYVDDGGPDGPSIDNLRERRYRVRAFDINGKAGPWSSEARLPGTSFHSVQSSYVDGDKIEVAFSVSNPDGRRLHLLVHRRDDPAAERQVAEFELHHAKRYRHIFAGLTPETWFRVALDFAPTFDSPRLHEEFERTNLAGTRTTNTAPHDTAEAVEVEGAAVGEEARLAVAMGGEARYRLRLLPCDNGRGSVERRIVEVEGVGSTDGVSVAPSELRLDCADTDAWATVTVSAETFEDDDLARLPLDVVLTHEVWNDDTVDSRSRYLVARDTGRVRVTVTAPGQLAAPENVAFDAAAGRLGWDAVAGARRYQVEWRPGDAPYGHRARQVLRSADQRAFDLGRVTWTAARVRSLSASDVSPWVEVIRPGGPATVSVGDAQAHESGDGSESAMRFPVRLSAPSADEVTVDYATADGTAVAGVDYRAASGTVTFAPGDTLHRVSVAVLDDTVEDDGETFALVLSGAEGAPLGDREGTGRILNSDEPDGPRLAVADAAASEDEGALVFTVTLAPAAASGASVGYATRDATAHDGADYEGVSGTLTFAAGETEKTVSVALIADRTEEGEETLELVLSGAAGASIADDTGTGTIRDGAPALAATFPASAPAPARHTGSADRPVVVVAFNRAVAAFAAATPSVAVTGAAVESVARHEEDGLDHAWAFTLAPAGPGDIAFALVADQACEDGGICADDGARLGTVPEALTLSGPDNSPATGAPAIAGTARVGELLTADTSGIADADGFDRASFSYRWVRGAADIEGAAGVTYEAVAEDEGETLTVRVEFRDDEGHVESLTSAGREIGAAVRLEHQPHGLRATVGPDGVTLAWEEPETGNYSDDWVILRHRPELGESEPAPYAEYVRLAERTFVDEAVEPGVLYVYAVKVVKDLFGFTGPASRSVQIRVPEGGAEAEAQAVTATVTVAGAAAADSFGVRVAFSGAVSGFGASDLTAGHVGGGAAEVSELVEAEAGRAWTARVATAGAGRMWVRVGAVATLAGGESRSAYLVVDVDEHGAAAAVAGPAVVEARVREPEDGAWTAGDTVEALLRFSEAVRVDTTGGLPSVGLLVDGRAERALYSGGSGGGQLGFAWTVPDGGTAGTVSLTADSLTLGGAEIEGGGRSAGLAHPGAEHTVAGPEADALTASFGLVPSLHNGSMPFELRLTFSEEVALSFRALRDEVAIAVEGGEVEEAKRVEQGSNRAWRLRVAPDGDGAVTVRVPETTDCTAAGAICTGDGGKRLSAAAAVTVPGPEAAVASDPDALTAAFEEVPAEHDGESAFTFRVRFSEPAAFSYEVLRDESFAVAGGTVTKALRVDGRNDLREIHVAPAGVGDVTVTLAGGRACGTTGAVCGAGGKVLSNTETATVPGPPGLGVADARVQEGPGAVLDFVVTLSRAPFGAVTVAYATSDGSAVAGADYTETSGTLTFAAGETEKTVAVPVLDDGVDEGEETMTLTLSNPSGAYLADATATGTIENSDPMPQAWLARFGRTVADHVVDAVGTRLMDPSGGGSHVTLAGQRIGLDGSGAAEAGAPSTVTGREAVEGLSALAERIGGTGEGDAGARREADGADARAQSMTAREALLGSSFHLSLGGAEDGAGLADTRLAAWGRAAVSRFDGDADGLALDGEVTTFTLGADMARERWLAGVAVSVSEGEGSFRDHGETDHPSRGTGTLESSLTGVHPYARLEVNERLMLWGLVGYGTGELTLEVEGGARSTTDISQEMAAVGARGVLVPAAAPGGFELAARSDAVVQRMRSDAARWSDGGNLAATQAATSRLRLVLEGARSFQFGDGATLTPVLEAGLRHDGGDAETGTGVELGGGLLYADQGSGLTMEAKARGLVAHEETDYREWGVSGAVRLEPDASGRGLSFSLAPAWGADAAGGAERLWSLTDARQLAPEGEVADPASRVEAEMGYGFSVLGGRAVATPHAGWSRSGESESWHLGQRLALGASEWTLESAFGEWERRFGAGYVYRLGNALELGVDASRREPANDAGPEHAIGLRLTARW